MQILKRAIVNTAGYAMLLLIKQTSAFWWEIFIGYPDCLQFSKGSMHSNTKYFILVRSSNICITKCSCYKNHDNNSNSNNSLFWYAFLSRMHISDTLIIFMSKLKCCQRIIKNIQQTQTCHLEFWTCLLM